jgi:hypothetical protein
MLSLEELTELGLRQAEQSVRDSLALDYAAMKATREGKQIFYDAIDKIAARDPFDGYRYDAPNSGDRQPGTADVGGKGPEA